MTRSGEEGEGLLGRGRCRAVAWRSVPCGVGRRAAGAGSGTRAQGGRGAGGLVAWAAMRTPMNCAGLQRGPGKEWGARAPRTREAEEEVVFENGASFKRGSWGGCASSAPTSLRGARCDGMESSHSIVSARPVWMEGGSMSAVPRRLVKQPSTSQHPNIKKKPKLFVLCTQPPNPRGWRDWLVSGSARGAKTLNAMLHRERAPLHPVLSSCPVSSPSCCLMGGRYLTCRDLAFSHPFFGTGVPPLKHTTQQPPHPSCTTAPSARAPPSWYAPRTSSSPVKPNFSPLHPFTLPLPLPPPIGGKTESQRGGQA